jgi:hypothetical protein
VLCGSVDERRAGEYMAEVRTSSQCERPCAGIEETRTAPADAGGSKDPGPRKVHSLIDKVYAPANLAEAWRHVRDNKGGAGIDGLTIAAFADREEERLAALHRKLRDRSYRPTPVKRVGIPKPDGGLRKLGIPSVTDRVVQQALVQKMAPIFEPHFADCSFGSRPVRSPHMAMRKVWQEINEGNFWILDADIRAFFDLACWCPPQQADRGSKARRSSLPALNFRNALSVRGTSGNKYSPVWASGVMAIVPLWMRS